MKKDLEGQKKLKLTDPSTWFGGGEVTPQASEELKGLDKRRADAKAKAKQILQGGLDIKASEVRMEAERAQRMAMQEQLVAGTVGRVEEMGLLPEQYPTIASDQNFPSQAQSQIAKTPEQKQLGKFSPQGEKTGEQLLPPKPSAIVDVPEALQGIQIPGNPDVKQWTEEDKAAWDAMSPEQKKQWVANRPNVGQIDNAEAQKMARPQAW